MIFPKKIETARLTIQRFQKDDISNEYISWLNDPDKLQYSNQRFKIHTPNTCLNYLSSFDQNHSLMLSIKSKSETGPSSLVGTATVYHGQEHNTADVGILIGVSGKGFGSEAWNIIINTLAKQKIRKITAGCSDGNIAMKNIAQKAGMVLDCVRTKQELIDGQPTDVIHYAYFPT